MVGKLFQRNISGHTLNPSLAVAMEYFLLFIIGIIAILLHAHFRSPLNIPGHHGLEFMALIMAGRTASKIKWASSISSFGIGFILLFPLFGFKDPFMGINYMFPGFVLDIVYNLTRRFKWQWIILALISGVAYFTIPLSRIVIHFISGYPYSSFIKFGYYTPLFNFFMFGLTGGLIGTGFMHLINKRIRRK